MKKTKILSAFIFITICLFSPFLHGCSKNDFVQVRSVTYSIGDEITTLYSTVKAYYHSATAITEEEYYNAPSEQRISPPDGEFSIIPANFKLPDSHKGQATGSILPTETDPEALLRYSKKENILLEVTYYTKATYGGLHYQYVLVKRVNDNTIIIKYRGEEKTCMVTSFQLNYF